MNRILLTCFEPFNQKATNTTMQVIEKIEDNNIYKLTLPVSYARSVEVLMKAVNEYKPDLIISLGEANRTKNVEIEKYAHNILHASIPDNDGVIKINETIKDSVLCLTPNYNVYEMVDKLSKDGYNVIMSQSAGSYICNLIMYTILELKEHKTIKDTAFIHIPHLEDNELDNLEWISKCINQFIIYLKEEYTTNDKKIKIDSVKKKITSLQRKKIETIYNLKVKEAEAVITMTDRVNGVLAEARTALEDIYYMRKELEYINYFIGIINDYINQAYTKIPLKMITKILGAVLYFITPYDIIPDKMPVVGYFDEIYVIEKCLSSVDKELDKYFDWKEKQK